MSIDLSALDRAATGDGGQMMSVRRAWLREVHTMLTDGAAAQRRLAALEAERRMRTGMDDILGKLYGAGLGR